MYANPTPYAGLGFGDLPDEREPTDEERAAERLAYKFAHPKKHGLCVECAGEGIERQSAYDLCDDCWDGHVASRKIDKLFLALLYTGEPATFVDRAGKRHHVAIASRYGSDIPVKIGGDLFLFDHVRGESPIGYLEQRDADHPILLARIAEREKREREAAKRAEKKAAALAAKKAGGAK